MNAVRVIITGRVQGVSYRHWTVRTATKLGLDGFVRNRRDGTVEAVFSGPQDAIRAMLEQCKKGPIMARVDAIDTHGWDEAVDKGFSEQATV